MTNRALATIHFARIGKPEAIYSEGLIEDDGLRLRTDSVIPPEHSAIWSERWQQLGLIEPGQAISRVSKYHFYQENFDILELRDADGVLLGYYCDIVTPIQ